MNVSYRQPHLVEPMKLRVYDDLPATPLTSDFAQFSQWGRNLASRASSRASRISLKRRTMSKSMISKPLPLTGPASDLPFRRRREFTPIQLSIYDPLHRLSPLPEFDRLSFTEVGELKKPPRVLVRTQSEDVLQTYSPVVEMSKRTLSMLDTTSNLPSRPETSYSIISTSRPPSEYDALHSHPVSSASLPGISTQRVHKTESSFAILTPMQEEFSPTATAVIVDGTMLNFPKELKPARAVVVDTQDDASSEVQAPFPVISRGPSNSASTIKGSPLRPHLHTNYQTHKRISQWLHNRTQSSSSTAASFSSGASFAEHRRKRSEFYKLGQVQVPNVTSSASPPQPLNFSKTHQKPVHQRSNTESTAHSTVGTSVLSSEFDYTSRRGSRDSMTTLTLADLNSRTGTMKSVLSPGGFRIVNADEKDVVVTTALCGEIVDDDSLYLNEIHGHLRSPGVGIAF